VAADFVLIGVGVGVADDMTRVVGGAVDITVGVGGHRLTADAGAGESAVGSIARITP
jgi:hypothetical protein